LNETVNITAIPDANVTRPQWNWTCLSEDNKTVSSGSVNSSSLNVAKNSFQNETMCTANYSVEAYNNSNGFVVHVAFGFLPLNETVVRTGSAPNVTVNRFRSRVPPGVTVNVPVLVNSTDSPHTL